MDTKVRKGQFTGMLGRDAFGERFRQHFFDPAFDRERDALRRIEPIAWEAYEQSRKAPRTHKAGTGFADPDYDLSVEWRATHQRLKAAQQRWSDPANTFARAGDRRRVAQRRHLPGRDLQDLPPGADRARDAASSGGIEVDLLDLSLLTSDYGRHIHPCKGCVSTAMPLCHWPCSCYPNHALGQTNDWMAEIYERWVVGARRDARDAGVLVPGAEPAQADDGPAGVRRRRQPRPHHHARQGRRRRRRRSSSPAGPIRSTSPAAPTAWWCTATSPASKACGARCRDWLDWMGLIDAGAACAASTASSATTSRTPPATRRSTTTRRVQEEVRNAARALVHAIGEVRKGTLSQPDKGLKPPRPK